MSIPKSEIFISVDVEASGPIPGEYSLLSIGACLVSDTNKKFYCELKPINDNFVPKAMEVNGLSMAKLAVDGSRRDLITISTLGLTMNYELGGEGIDLIFNGESLVGRQTTINLGESKTHELVISCP